MEGSVHELWMKTVERKDKPKSRFLLSAHILHFQRCDASLFRHQEILLILLFKQGIGEKTKNKKQVRPPGGIRIGSSSGSRLGASSLISIQKNSIQ